MSISKAQHCKCVKTLERWMRNVAHYDDNSWHCSQQMSPYLVSVAILCDVGYVDTLQTGVPLVTVRVWARHRHVLTVSATWRVPQLWHLKQRLRHRLGLTMLWSVLQLQHKSWLDIRHKKFRPVKSSDKAEDLPLLGSFFNLPPFRCFEILPLFPNFTGHSKYPK